MKILVLAGVAAIAAGCGGGVTKEEMQTMRQELLAHDAESAAKLRTELTGVDKKFAQVQQIEGDVNKKLDELARLQKDLVELSKSLQARVDLANTNVLKVLEFEERLLAERLASIRGMIEELKKK
ncbi:MAG TPA: hypothetical protein VJB14_02595 [Planctomycetota bacterium]|nr:hypothetical protein [Planctomycetota bacterium]